MRCNKKWYRYNFTSFSPFLPPASWMDVTSGCLSWVKRKSAPGDGGTRMPGQLSIPYFQTCMPERKYFSLVKPLWFWGFLSLRTESSSSSKLPNPWKATKEIFCLSLNLTLIAGQLKVVILVLEEGKLVNILGGPHGFKQGIQKHPAGYKTGDELNEQMEECLNWHGRIANENLCKF